MNDMEKMIWAFGCLIPTRCCRLETLQLPFTCLLLPPPLTQSFLPRGGFPSHSNFVNIYMNKINQLLQVFSNKCSSLIPINIELPQEIWNSLFGNLDLLLEEARSISPSFYCWSLLPGTLPLVKYFVWKIWRWCVVFGFAAKKYGNVELFPKKIFISTCPQSPCNIILESFFATYPFQCSMLLEYVNKSLIIWKW